VQRKRFWYVLLGSACERYTNGVLCQSDNDDDGNADDLHSMGRPEWLGNISDEEEAAPSFLPAASGVGATPPVMMNTGLTTTTRARVSA
jgi:hypothetical protein